jgi:two-component system, LytTR family, response regulator
VHRSTIINMDQVHEILRKRQSEESVVLRNGRRLKMSKAVWQSLLMASRR